MIRVATTLVRWACDPAKLEVLEGDLRELHDLRCRRQGSSRAGWRTLGDALSVCVRHSRLTTPAARRRAVLLGAVGAAAAIVALGADPARVGTAPLSYIVTATDPAGRFTLEIENARVVRATLDDLPVDPTRLLQAGRTLVIKGGDRGRDFRLALQPAGGITWTARTP